MDMHFVSISFNQENVVILEVLFFKLSGVILIVVGYFISVQEIQPPRDLYDKWNVSENNKWLGISFIFYGVLLLLSGFS